MTVGTKENQRLQQRFRLWDRNNDGFIERSDFEAEADALITRLGAAGTAKGIALKGAYVGMFEHLARAADSTRISLDQLIQVIDQNIVPMTPAGFANAVAPAIRAIVEVLDTDGDGEVGPAEMAKWFDVIGLEKSLAEDAFRQLDSDGTGKLSVTELVNAVRDYHLGKHDIPLLGV